MSKNGQEYDAYGRPSVLTYPGGFKIQDVYTPLGYLKEVRAAGGATSYAGDALPNQLFWQASGYTVNGSIDTMILGNGLTFRRLISDVTGRVKAMTTESTPGGGSPQSLQEQLYTYDAVGQVTARVDEVTGQDETYTYDGLNRLTNWYFLKIPGYAALGPTNSTQVAVQYDALGNITYKSDAGVYAYAAAHAHGIASISGGPLGNLGYAYDANGNTTADGRRNYSWTSANKLSHIANMQNGDTTDFSFDADNQRIEQVEQGASEMTMTIYGAPNYEKVYHSNGGMTEQKYYIMTPFGRTAVRTVRSDNTVEVRYLHQDALGSVTLVTDEYGRVETRFAYDPWGQRIKVVNARVNTNGEITRGFTDHEHLEDFDLIHMNARVYDPATGRFLNADRVVQDMGDSQTYNRYSYCANNPVNVTDPTGNSFLSNLWNALENVWKSFTSGTPWYEQNDPYYQNQRDDFLADPSRPGDINATEDQGSNSDPSLGNSDTGNARTGIVAKPNGGARADSPAAQGAEGSDSETVTENGRTMTKKEYREAQARNIQLLEDKKIRGEIRRPTKAEQLQIDKALAVASTYTRDIVKESVAGIKSREIWIDTTLPTNVPVPGGTTATTYGQVLPTTPGQENIIRLNPAVFASTETFTSLSGDETANFWLFQIMGHENHHLVKPDDSEAQTWSYQNLLRWNIQTEKSVFDNVIKGR